MILSLLLAAPALDAAARPCERGSGFVAQAVPDAETAKRLFRVIAPSFQPLRDRRPNAKRYVLKVEESDDRKSWIVVEDLPSPPGIIRAGGGGLAMTIDKCSGAVSEPALQR